MLFYDGKRQLPFFRSLKIFRFYNLLKVFSKNGKRIVTPKTLIAVQLFSFSKRKTKIQGLQFKGKTSRSEMFKAAKIIVSSTAFN
jgi:uncharacterized protein YhbP (UPF0306 family)